MTHTDWTVSIYAGAAFGGVFWLILPISTTLLRSNSSPHASLATTAIAINTGLIGLVLIRAKFRRTGVAITIGAIIGLPVLAWLTLWQTVI
jgi:predicted permease